MALVAFAHSAGRCGGRWSPSEIRGESARTPASEDTSRASRYAEINAAGGLHLRCAAP
jgi:hypothetical protein